MGRHFWALCALCITLCPAVECIDCSDCNDGSFLSKPCTDFDDRVCIACADGSNYMQTAVAGTVCMGIFFNNVSSTVYCPEKCMQDIQGNYTSFFGSCPESQFMDPELINDLCPTQTLEQQGRLLLDFKRGIVNADCDAFMSTWTGDNVCEWEGIQCSHGLVAGVGLCCRPVPLTGIVSPALSQIKTLAYVDLSNNDLCGSITSFSHHELLDTLVVANNSQLCGGKPEGVIIGSTPYDELDLDQECSFSCPTKDSWLLPQSKVDQVNLLFAFKQGILNAEYIPALVTWNNFDPCGWEGIECWEEGLFLGLVKSLRLPGQVPKLVGGIAAELTEIQSLVELDLSGNLLCGEIPEFQASACAHAANLTHLSLHLNTRLCVSSALSFPMMSNNGGLNLVPNPNCGTDCPSTMPLCEPTEFIDWEEWKCNKCEGCPGSKYRAGCGNGSPGFCQDCTECESGFFKKTCEENCQVCEACPENQYNSDCDGNQMHSGKCSVCEPCQPGKFRKGCEGVSPGICISCTGCPAHQRRVNCSGTDEGICIDCDECSEGKFRRFCQGIYPGKCEHCPGCPRGTYRSGCEKAAQGSCVACAGCPTGQFRQGCFNTTAGSCVDCETTCGMGFYRDGCHSSSPGKCVACASCPAGSYRKDCNGINPGICEVCAECPFGMYRPKCPGKCVACPTCAGGLFRNECHGQSEGYCEPCPSCPSGEFLLSCELKVLDGMPQTNLTCSQCQGCPGGEYRADCYSSTSGHCAEVRRGMFSKENDPRAHPCPSGHVAGEPGMEACTSCLRGTFATSPDGECALCDPGTITPFNAMTSCAICPDGQIQTDAGQWKCDFCPSGSEWVNSTYCKACEAGTFSDGKGPCLPCEPGQYSGGSESECHPCRKGSFSEHGGAVEDCELCGQGQWSGEGESACTPIVCPRFAHKDINSGCQCDDGYEGSIIWNDGKGEFDGACEPCAVGYTSIGGSSCSKVDCPTFSSEHPDCQCASGYEGALTWNGREYLGICTETGCPANSLKVADPADALPYVCACADGYQGEITPSFDGFSGICTPCRSGFYRTGEEEECTRVECPTHAIGAPHCKCSDGYLGEISWLASKGVYQGSCTPCPRGFANTDGQGCMPVTCPDGSSGHPECLCNIGFHGSVHWTGASYSGGCHHCLSGTWSDRGSRNCTKTVVCPVNSQQTVSTTGSRHCECRPTFSGAISWDHTVGTFMGSCTPCARGFTSKVHGALSCDRITCPAHATRHPDCSCDDGYVGKPLWDRSTGSYVGNCEACIPGEYRSNGMERCEKCPPAMWSTEGSAECVPASCPEHAISYPDCRCRPGHTGAVVFDHLTGEYKGKCSSCAEGYWSPGGNSTCVKVECPDHSINHPDCECTKGTIGVTAWDHELGAFLGTCSIIPCPTNSSNWPHCECDSGCSGMVEWLESTYEYSGGCKVCPDGKYQDESGQPGCKTCEIGYHPSSPTTCAPVECPAYSSGHPDCTCNPGASGLLVFNRQTSTYWPLTGCSPCPKGFWSAGGQSKCEPVECSGLTEGHPDCACMQGYRGEIAWNDNEGRYEGTCTEEGCPDSAVGYPICECNPGFKGVLIWENATQIWDGACLPCELGTGSFQGDSDCFELPCPAHSSDYPYCKCERGFTGNIQFNGGQYHGKCSSCPVGYWSEGGSLPCHHVECPPDMLEHPQCKCRAGMQAKAHVKWNNVSGVFDGACESCPIGTWSVLGGDCTAVPCPVHSHSHPHCQCDVGYEGSTIFRNGHYEGQCTKCPKGTGSVSGMCSAKVECPTGSVGYPDCVCPAMTHGNIVWVHNSSLSLGGTYLGECQPCGLGEFSGEGSTTCSKSSCPVNSAGWPRCECSPGFSGHVTWSSVHGSYEGSCSACGPGSYQDLAGQESCHAAGHGFWSNENRTGSVAIACPEHAGSHPLCHCSNGFQGSLFWHNGAWSGTCQPCASGYWSAKGSSSCEKVECPPHSAGHPRCRCDAGFFSHSELSWNRTIGQYNGQCHPCGKGSWSQQGATECKRVSCPENSQGHPDCNCVANAAGQISWDGSRGAYLGDCEICDLGYRPEAIECVHEECPEDATEHPRCECNDGSYGNITWLGHPAYRFVGQCRGCPSGVTTSSSGRASCDVTVPCPDHSTRTVNGTCTCNHDYTGTIVWDARAGAFHGTCTDIRCPYGSSGYPDCACNNGYEEVSTLMYLSNEARWTGECKPCAKGSWTMAEDECEEVVCPQHATGHPKCTCMFGYAGSIRWFSGRYVGECKKCEQGMATSSDGLSCEFRACPEHSKREITDGIATCTCNAGYAGRVSWSGSDFEGTCFPCGKGFWSEAGDHECTKVTCPVDSTLHPSCACMRGYFGVIAWDSSTGAYSGQCSACPLGFSSEIGQSDCSPVMCPIHSSGHPTCSCDAPRFFSSDAIEWDPSSRVYTGSCEECPPGHWSDGRNCFAETCPPHSSGVDGECFCATGYAGKIVWTGWEYDGVCKPCSKGYTSIGDTTACVLVSCPSNGVRHPRCECKAGYMGSLVWQPASHSYTGECVRCPAGEWSTASGFCARKTCPPHSFSKASADGLMGCVCDINYHGELTWNFVTGEYDGHCQPCGAGYRSAAGDSRCQFVPCPDPATNHPMCTCPMHHSGSIFWIGMQSRYEGFCIPNPTPSVSPTPSISRSPSTSLIPPSPSYIPPSNTPSPTSSPSKSMAPSPTPCIETRLRVVGAGCRFCNGVYRICGSDPAPSGKLRLCKENTAFTSGTIEFKDGRWVLSEGDEALYTASNDGNTLPPRHGWTTLYPEAHPSADPPMTFQECSAKFFRAIKVSGTDITLAQHEGVMLALQRTLRIPRPQIELKLVIGNKFFFTIDLRLTPTRIDEILKALSSGIEDETMLNWLLYYKINAFRVEQTDIAIEPQIVVPAPSPSPGAEASPIPNALIPPMQGTRDSHGCVPGSKWCEELGECIDAQLGCHAESLLSADCEEKTPQEAMDIIESAPVFDENVNVHYGGSE